MAATILITGAFGYVGGRVSRYLAACTDYRLRLVSHRPGRPTPVWLRDGMVATCDLAADDLTALVEGVDIVVHLAALNENDCQADPERALVVNGLATARLLEACRNVGVARFIYFSTARIYGEPLIGRIDEKMLPRPIHPYGITHRTAEDLVLALHDRGVLSGVALRLSNGFGAPDDPGVNRWTLLANDLCRQAATQGKLVLRSSGLQLRNFITLHDVGRAVQHVAELDTAALGDGIFNLGGEASISVLDMTHLIARRCGSVLGFTPEVVRPEPTPDESVQELDYRVDKLAQTRFALTSTFDEEIDACLRLCRDAFAR